MVSRVHPGQSFDNIYSPLIMPFVVLREYLSVLSTGPVHTEQLQSLSVDITGQGAGEPQINGECYRLTRFILFVNSHKRLTTNNCSQHAVSNTYCVTCNDQVLSCEFKMDLLSWTRLSFFLKRSTLSQSQLVSAQLNHSLLCWPLISFTAVCGWGLSALLKGTSALR